MERTNKHFRKRDAILNCVRSTTAHPSADWVFEHVKEQVPDISLATVYRNLAMFKREGTIGSVCIEDGMERFDRTAEPHAHFICNGCHSVQDLMELSLSSALCKQAAETLQAEVDACHVIFRGHCTQCRQV